MTTFESHGDTVYDGEKVLGYKPYEINDGGITHGFGHFQEYGSPLTPWLAEAYKNKDYLSVEECEELYANDLEAREKWIETQTDHWFTQYEYDAMVSITFNSQATAKKLLIQINEDNITREGFEKIIYDHVMEYTRKKHQLGVLKRRQGELNIFFDADYTGTQDNLTPLTINMNDK